MEILKKLFFIFTLLPMAAMGQEQDSEQNDGANKITISDYHYTTLGGTYNNLVFRDVPNDVDFRVYYVSGSPAKVNDGTADFTIALKPLTIQRSAEGNDGTSDCIVNNAGAGLIIYASQSGDYRYEEYSNTSSQHRIGSAESGCPSYIYSFDNMLMPGDDNYTVGEIMANATLSPEVVEFMEEYGDYSAASMRRTGDQQVKNESDYYYYKLTVGSEDGYIGRFGFFWGTVDGAGGFTIPADKCFLSLERKLFSSQSPVRLKNTSLILGEEDGLVTRLDLVPVGDAPALPAVEGVYDLSGKSYPEYLSGTANGCLHGITIQNGRKTIR